MTPLQALENLVKVAESVPAQGTLGRAAQAHAELKLWQNIVATALMDKERDNGDAPDESKST